jgi:hypothetical protein
MQLVINGQAIGLDSTTKCSSGTGEASWLATTRHSFEVHCTLASASSFMVTYSGQDTRDKPVTPRHVPTMRVCMYVYMWSCTAARTSATSLYAPIILHACVYVCVYVHAHCDSEDTRMLYIHTHTLLTHTYTHERQVVLSSSSPGQCGATATSTCNAAVPITDISVQFNNASVVAAGEVGMDIGMTTTVPIGINQTISIALSGFSSNITDIEFGDAAAFTQDYAFTLNTEAPRPTQVLLGCIDPKNRYVVSFRRTIYTTVVAMLLCVHHHDSLVPCNSNPRVYACLHLET